MNTKIIYHKNCMDGLASAFIAKGALGLKNENCIAVQYGEEQILFDRYEYAKLNTPLTKEDTIFFVDFSLKRDLMIELASKVKHIYVLDHHKTAQKELDGLNKELDNITIKFNMNFSGAILSFSFFDCINPRFMRHINKTLFEYIEDRDLWKWELAYSKEINAYLRFLVKPNDLDSFETAYINFCEEVYIEKGSMLLAYQDIQVQSKIKKTKDITLNGITFKALNATENISEIGNAICDKYGTPALVYFITEHDDVVCSLRSIDALEDVSVVAKAFGGGGHRNACGFTTHLDHLADMLIGV